MESSVLEIDRFLESHTVKEWVHQYLSNWGNNSRLSWELSNKKSFFVWPKSLSLEWIIRTCWIGDEEYKENVWVWKRKTSFLQKIISLWCDVGPLIVRYEKWEYYLYDGNHRHFVLTELGIRDYPCIVVYDNLQDIFINSLFIPYKYAFSITDNPGSPNRQIDLLEVLLRKELYNFEIYKVESSKQLDKLLSQEGRLPTIFLLDQKIELSRREMLISRNFSMSDANNGFEIVDSLIDCVIRNSFL